MGEGKLSPTSHNKMQKVFDYLLSAFVFLSATFYINGKTFYEAQDMVFKLGVAVLFILSLYLVPRRKLINPYVNAFLGLSLVVFLFGVPGSKEIMIEPLVKIFLGSMLFYLVCNYCGNRKLIYDAICAVVAVSFIMVMLQFFNVDPLCLNDRGMPSNHIIGLFGYKQNLGAYMALALPILLINKRWVFAGMALLMPFMSESWAAIGVMYIAVLFLIFYLSRKKFILSFVISLVVIVSIFALFLNKPHENLDLKNKLKLRWISQTKFLKVLMSNPYFGTGLGTFKYLSREIITIEPYGTWLDAGNDYLEYPMDMGLGVLFIIVGLYYYIWNKFKHSPSRELVGIMAGLITIALGIAFHTYKNHPNLITISIVMLGLFEIVKKEEKCV